ncbi:hypothetical protein COCSADRAFT_98441 [Bipolaris sorokiniana ND90Pr]|uniref:non-specific serine/threonine protein kinase n=1 Tax=Cochliobolus sativus (strain ND90Pr / ATCC 201652) TaxID=665912 RepID=M2SU12_COCSN|nr:uncharacterized protein COCSADRAFT_98441 [Bipolaris sorokiniana ND90Pr]EMD60566.1 hypothetical protein COCSADRAFT_98441 [Bipolaris sorokiniana ND90Pr]
MGSLADVLTPPGSLSEEAPFDSLSQSEPIAEYAPLVKTKSTPSLLNYRSGPPPPLNTAKRLSIDAGQLDRMARSPIVPEHEHGLGSSGLRRIRQQPSHKQLSTSQRAASLNIGTPPVSRHPSESAPTAPASPTFAFGEDLSRFPSESLHSFSFATQSEEFIHNRQNVLKRSIEFMRDRLGWAATNPGIANAQAKLSGDQEVQSMMELLTRANLIGQDGTGAHGLGALGPVTGPADMSGNNPFEKGFMAERSVSPESMLEPARPSLHRVTTVDGGDSSSASDSRGARSSSSTDRTSDTSSTRTPAAPSSPPPTSQPPRPQRAALKRTLTDVVPLTIQSQLNDALAQPYRVGDQEKVSDLVSPTTMPSLTPSFSNASVQHSVGAAPHGHGSRHVPAAQAIFTTETESPWTITSANDLACLVFGVTRAEVRKLGILEVVREDRRKWLESKLRDPEVGSKNAQSAASPGTNNLKVGSGVTARLLSKAPSRVTAARKAKTDDGSGSSYYNAKKTGKLNHESKGSRGVLLCGDVIPIQKRNGSTGSASLWVKEKRGSLIWVLEEIAEDVVYITVDEVGCVSKGWGATEAVFGSDRLRRGMDLKRLIPGIPRLRGTNTGALDYDSIDEFRSYTARTSNSINIPVTVEALPGEPTFRISSFPHIAGIIVLNSADLKITSSNSVFSSALFGQPRPEGIHVSKLIPAFDRILHVMTDEDKIELVDGIVIPEHSFRRARALLAMREGSADAAAIFLKPSGLPALHRDGSEIMVDVQMRVVKSEKTPRFDENVIEEEDGSSPKPTKGPELVYALWITYSRQLHAANHGIGPVTPLLSRPPSPRQLQPGQSSFPIPHEPESHQSQGAPTSVSLITQQIQEAMQPMNPPEPSTQAPPSAPMQEEPPHKKTINDFVVLEEMGQGAYGQVKLCRYKKASNKKVVIKYVTKRRILVDTWTRDRRLGTVPLEIHVLDYLRRDGFKHPNIVEMADFFEDDINYYIEMIPHGLPGMDLFDYIELRVNMEEKECRKIFVQVAEAIHHLHTKAKVVHRDIKDENVVLDGEGNIKLIDFGSAAYIKSGPFDVFVGTIDYAAPEVLAGKAYRGKEQDVWALGILLYTIIYKENPFYSIDEIMDHDLRVPWVMSEESIDLVRLMLDRDVEKRITISMVLEHPWCKGVSGGELTPTAATAPTAALPAPATATASTSASGVVGEVDG